MKKFLTEDEIESRMVSGLKAVCDMCGASHPAEDEGLRCDCGGMLVLQYY